MLTLSDSKGYIHDPDGIDQSKLDWIKELKNVRRGPISDYIIEYKGATYHEGEKPWGVVCDLALPCATQNELLGHHAALLIKNGCYWCLRRREHANRPCWHKNLQGSRYLLRTR